MLSEGDEATRVSTRSAAARQRHIVYTYDLGRTILHADSTRKSVPVIPFLISLLLLVFLLLALLLLLLRCILLIAHPAIDGWLQ